MKAPTARECFDESETEYGRAFWTPQIGGYTAKALAQIDENGCVDIYVWHDGEHSTSDDRQPAKIHLCDPFQWDHFARFLEGL